MRGLLMVNTVAAFTSSAFALATPLISMVVYDRIIPHSSMHSMTAVVVAALVFVALDLSVRLARRAFMSARSKVLADQLAVAAFKGLMSEQRWTSGGGSEAVDRQIGTNLLKDADAVRNGLATAGATVFGEGPWLILFILVLVLLAPPVVAIVTAVAVTSLVGIGVFDALRAGRTTSRPSDRLSALRVATVTDGLSNRLLCMRLGVTAFFAERVAGATRLFDGGLDRHASTGLLGSLQAGWQQLVIIGVLALAAPAAMSREISMGALIATTILATRACATASTVAMAIPRVMDAWRARAHLVDLVADERARVPDMAGRALDRSPAGPGELVLKEVRVERSDGGPPILDNVTARFESGRIHVISGPSSVGKSTLEGVIAGLRRPNAGSVLVDGVPLHALSPQARRETVASCGQEDAQPITGTLLENIALGRRVPEAAAIELLRAMGPVGAALLAHPNAMTRQLGGPIGLSPSERQALRLARLLATRLPRVVVIDDPVAMVDAESARAIAALLERSLQGRTGIVFVNEQQRHLVVATLSNPFHLDMGAGGRLRAFLR